MTRLSGCPLGSSDSRPFILSWRALRLLSRAASSSSSSFFANLRETKEEREEQWGHKERLSFLFQLQLFNPSPPSPPFTQFSFTIRNFRVNDSLNWTVIVRVTKPAGFVQSLFFSSLLSSWPVNCATTNTSYRGCSFHKVIKTQSRDMAWLRIRAGQRNRASGLTAYTGLVSVGAQYSKLQRCVCVWVCLCAPKQPLAVKVYISRRNLIPY